MESSRWKTLWVESDLGAGMRGASLGPSALLLHALNHQITLPCLTYPDVRWNYQELSLTFPLERRWQGYSSLFQTLKKGVQPLLQDYLLWIFSGDHSCAAPLIAGALEVYNNLGVIWIDAHADLHTPATSPSGNPHGMPLALLLKENDPLSEWQQLLQQITVPLTPKNLVYVALRSYESEEMERIARLGIKVFSVEDVRWHSPATIVEKILSYLGDVPLYISFDIDCLDASLVPATGTPVANGLYLEHAEVLLHLFARYPNTKVIEITEFNPLLDEKETTSSHLIQLLKAAMTAR